MKKLIFVFVSTSLTATPAATMAQDIPVWKSGFYAGVNLGYGVGTNASAKTVSTPIYDDFADGFNAVPTPFVTLVNPISSGATSLANSTASFVNQSGIIGGGQVGYNYFLNNKVMIGIETDFYGSGIRGSGSSYGAATQNGSAFIPSSNTSVDVSKTSFGVNSISTSIDWLGTTRARAGYLVTDSVMLFGTAGLAYGGVNATTSHGLFSTSSVSVGGSNPYSFTMKDRDGSASGYFNGAKVGWSAGGGAEWMFAKNWSVKAEAIYYNLGSANITSNPKFSDDNGYRASVVNSHNTNVSISGITSKVGVNFHF